MTLPIPSGFYSDLMNGYYANLASAEQQTLWDKFTQYHGITATTPDTAQLRALFATYLKAVYNTQATAETTTALSPAEYQSRLVMFNTVQTITNMLDTLQNTVAAQSSTLIFYGTWQQEYTKMMTRIPNYTSFPTNAVVVNTNDLTKMTIGDYSKISFSDIIQWGVTQALNPPNYQPGVISGLPVFFGDASGTNTPSIGRFAFQATFPTAGKVAMTMTYERAPDTNRNPPVAGFGPISTSFLISSTVNSDTVYSTMPEQLQQAVSQWQQMISPPAVASALTTALTNVGGISGRFVQDDAANTSSRAEMNALLQQYVENTRSRRESVSKLASAMQTSLSQSRESLNQQTSLMTSILESIESVMKAIFK